MCDFLVYDISNILYRTFFAHKQEDDSTIAGLAIHTALVTLNKYFRQYKPKKKVVMAFDSSSWRKEYTSSEQCISKKPYKGNRRKDMSPSQQAKYMRFIEHLREFEKLISEHTTIIALRGEKLEADDLIAGFIQRHPDDNIVLISSDSDMLQLLKNPNLKIISPATDKELTLEEFDNDPKLYLFTKCLRGDPTDNIQSALPRVPSTRIRKAYKDPFERVQLMKEFWKDHEGNEFQVEKLFEENKMLIDLEAQPEQIREHLETVLNEQLSKERKFSLFHILKFCGKYELNKVKENIDSFVPLLSR